MTRRITILRAIPIALISLNLLSICRCDNTDTDKGTTGFTVDLIHRDSPRSPFYNSSSTPSRRLVESLARSDDRAKLLHAKTSSRSRPRRMEQEEEEDPEPQVVNSHGQYFIEYSVGTPPVPSIGSADTGSVLIWMQCGRCKYCFNQDLPVFNSMASSTYKQLSCNSTECNWFGEHYCSKSGNHCRYSSVYDSGLFSAGALSTDTFTLEPNISVPGVVFGCGSINMYPMPGGDSGIVALGAGPGSLIRQLGPIAHGKFSHCLVSVAEHDTVSSSKMHFGDHAVVSGDGAVSTPLVTSKKNFYFLTMEGISVGDRLVEAPPDPETPDSIDGNTIIDSGITVTMLRPTMYEEFEEVVRKSMMNTLEEMEDPVGIMRLCYSWDKNRKDVEIPEFTVHFRGANLRLEVDSIFARVTDDMMCLAVKPTPPYGAAIYGSLAQVNFLVAFDLHSQTVTFKPQDCSKQ